MLPSERSQQVHKKSSDYETHPVKDDYNVSDPSASSEGPEKYRINNNASLNMLQNRNHDIENESKSTSDAKADPLLQHEKDRRERTEYIQNIIHSRLGSSMSLSDPTTASQHHQQRLSSSTIVPPLLNFVQSTTSFMNRISSEANAKLCVYSNRLDRINRELSIIEERIDSVTIHRKEDF